MAKEKTKKAIETTMQTGGFPATGKPTVESKGPRKMAKGEISNVTSRPPKK